jgi:hypothetical protein
MWYQRKFCFVLTCHAYLKSDSGKPRNGQR